MWSSTISSPSVQAMSLKECPAPATRTRRPSRSARRSASEIPSIDSRMHDRRGTASLVTGPVAPLHAASCVSLGSRMMTASEPTPSTDVPSGTENPGFAGRRSHPIRHCWYATRRGSRTPESRSTARDCDRRRLFRYRAGGAAARGGLAHDAADTQHRAGGAAGGRAREQALPAGRGVAHPATRRAIIRRCGTRRLRVPGGALARAGPSDLGPAGSRAWQAHGHRVGREGPRAAGGAAADDGAERDLRRTDEWPAWEAPPTRRRWCAPAPGWWPPAARKSWRARSRRCSRAPASCASNPTIRSASSSRARPRMRRRWRRAPPRRQGPNAAGAAAGSHLCRGVALCGGRRRSTGVDDRAGRHRRSARHSVGARESQPPRR